MTGQARPWTGRWWGAAVVWSLSALCAAAPAGAVTLSIQADADTWLDAANTNAIHATDTTLGVLATPVQRAVIRFDLSEIPACGTLSSATLKMRVKTGAAGRVQEVHKLDAAWTEAGASWDCPDGNCPPTALWSGGSLEPTATDSKTEGGAGSLLRWDVTDDVGAFLLDPASNHGWAIIDGNEGTAQSMAVLYFSREDMNEPPLLDVTFTLDDAQCDDMVACHTNATCTVTGCTYEFDDTLCDDHIDCTADSCTATGCTNTPSNICCGQADGSPCDDNDSLCTPGQDTCESGQCVGAVPTNCRTAGKSILIIHKSSTTDRNRLVWKWLHGEATYQADFGNPGENTDGMGHRLCVYAGTGTHQSVVTDLAIPASSNLWRAMDSNGFKYDDSDGTSSGVQKVLLKGNDAGDTDPKSKVILLAKGANLPAPSIPVASFPVKAVLRNEPPINAAPDDTCWEATYESTDNFGNSATLLKLKSGPPITPSPTPTATPTATPTDTPM